MEKISEILNIEPCEIVIEETKNVSVVESTESPEDIDFETVRRNQYEILEKGNAALNTALMIVHETQNPRAIEVLATLLKNVSDANRQLLMLSKDKAEIKQTKSGKTKETGIQNNIQNAVFVGNGADLNKLLKGNKNENI